uniref:Integrase, catalytic region, zinc finger, CCHC-type, peptidase aspartic, catalytic n=1 Tax=Tanacetum cinerariifolium TaxID=118510 RepID=A0A699I7C6_TANCI|nr:integrase, catalytic region, zinc finger, CCHC-type, peptidase aspartic, catalytic [Tanacetum cinerariifolium]
MFKLNVSQYVSPISMSKSSCDSKNVEIKLKRKRHKRKSSKQNVKQVDNDVSRANIDFVYFSDLDTFISVRRPKYSGVVWKKKWFSNTSKVDLSVVRISNLNKNVKRYSLNDLLACNNSHLGETRSDFVCNDAMNILQICLWIIDSGCSKHMTGNRALLTNFVEKFLGTVRYGNNDFVVITGYGDVVIGSMTIKKLYYVEGLGNNLFSIGKFCDKGLEVAFRKSTSFVRNEDVVDLLTGDSSSNLYTISLNEVALNSSTCLLPKASSSQSWLWRQRLSHLNFATINNVVKNNLVQGLPKMNFKKDHLCSACRQGKIHQKHHKSKMAFASNKPLYLLHMDLCRPMRVENEASEVIISFIKKTQVNLQLQVQRVRTDNGTKFKNKNLAKFFDEVGISQQFSVARTPQQNGVLERRNRTLVEAARTMLTFANLPLFLWAEAIATTCFTQNRSIIHKRLDKTPYELINKRKPNIKFFRMFECRCYLLNDYEDVGKLKAKGDIRVFIMKSSTTNVETSNNEEVFYEVSESFQRESSSSSLNDDVQQSPEEVILPQPNTQSILNNMIPNGDKASTSHMRLINDWKMLTLMQDFTVFQMDVKTAFLNGILKEKVYVGQPLGIDSKQYPDHVYALDKALYGLKEAPRAWYDILSQFLIESVPTPMVEQAKLKLDLVGKPVDHTDYRSMIGSLMYVTSSRPDIMFATCMCARYQENPNEHHVSAIKRIFRYLKGTINLGLWYLKDSSFDLTVYSNADHAGCHLDRRKSEYVAVSSCCAQVLWMRTQLTGYGLFYDKVPIYCDSKSAIAISCNLVQHTRTKHIDVRTRIDLPWSLPSHLGKLGLGDGV